MEICRLIERLVVSCSTSEHLIIHEKKNTVIYRETVTTRSRRVRGAPVERETRVKRLKGGWIKHRGREENNAGGIMAAYTPPALEKYFKGPPAFTTLLPSQKPADAFMCSTLHCTALFPDDMAHFRCFHCREGIYCRSLYTWRVTHKWEFLRTFWDCDDAWY